MSKVIGIDLGTTNSCVSVVENNEAVIIPSKTGARTTPSIVAFSKSGERFVGETARRQAVTNPDRTITSVKRHMGTDWAARIDDKIYKPQTISAMILAQLKKDAEEFLGEPVTDAVITVPAYFNDVQRQATKDAGAIAGLNVKRIINEPTSAALSYGLDHGEPQKILVYDLGGGTFDVSVIEIGEGVIEVLATSGNNHLGGDDFDKCLTDYIIDAFRKENGIDLTKNFAAYTRVKEAAEQAKKELSAAVQTQINLPYIADRRGEPLHLDMTITRAQFESLITPLVNMTEAPVRNALSDAGISAEQLNRVLLVGGSTRIPLVENKVRTLTGKIPSKNINPDECVAKGAALQGSVLQGNSIIASGTGSNLLLFDVTPLSLAIETIGGVATTLIKRNSTIPTKHSQIFSTAAPFQRSVDIRVLQGDRPMARDNKLIGKFRLGGIKPAPAGVPQIEVTFDIDVNGILKVSAKDLSTGKEQSVTITADDRMSESEISAARAEAAAYAGLDSLRSEALELIRESQELIRKTEAAIKDAGKTMDKRDKKTVSADLKNLQKQIARCKVDRITEEDIRQIRQAKETLEQSSGSLH